MNGTVQKMFVNRAINDMLVEAIVSFLIKRNNFLELRLFDGFSVIVYWTDGLACT